MIKKDINIVTRKEVRMLSPKVAEMLNEYHWRRKFGFSECLMKDDDHGTKGAEPAIIPHIKNSKRRIVYYGNEFNGSYNHHNQIAKFKGKYFFSWSNGFRNEEDAGQRVLIAESEDCLAWSEPLVVLDTAEGEEIAHNCVAMYSTENALYIVIMTEETIHDATVTGMRRINPETAYMDVYKSMDGRVWEKAFSFGSNIKWIFEAPRLTAEGRLMCVCNTKKDGPAVLLWPGDNICETPEFIHVPEPEGASFPYGESTWYQMDNGRIMVFWRDEGASCHMFVNYSDDNGKTWCVPMLADIPDSMSRIYAGRFNDGRYYIVNNAIASLLDRIPLCLLISDDGYVFNKVYMINDSPAAMRRKGLLKENGHQYPCCIVDGDRLIVAYDANKEDTMVEIIDICSL